jgi:hypothetical protein
MRVMQQGFIEERDKEVDSLLLFQIDRQKLTSF